MLVKGFTNANIILAHTTHACILTMSKLFFLDYRDRKLKNQFGKIWSNDKELATFYSLGLGNLTNYLKWLSEGLSETSLDVCHPWLEQENFIAIKWSFFV